MQVLIRQAKVSDPGSTFHNKTVDITIKDGIISKITASKKKTGGGSIEVSGKTVYTAEKSAPIHVSSGWVDILADYCEPGLEQKETINTGLAAAAKGGFAHVFMAPNTEPAISSKSIIEFLLKKASGHVVNLHPLGSISQNLNGTQLAEMMDMQAHGAIAFTDGWQPVQNANVMLKALEYVKAFNGTLIQIPQDDSIASTGLMHEGLVSTRMGMAAIPPEAETIIIARDLQLLNYTDSRLHFTGVSTAAGVDMIRKAKRQKLNVTCSVTPYHLALNDEALTGYDSMYKVSPPIRSEKDRKALVKGLKDGTIDCITSHHRPHEWDAKTKEFEYAAYGMNVQEATFNIIWDALADEVGMDRLIDALAIKPRELFGLEACSIDKGNAASLTIFSPKANTVLNEMKSAAKNNPFIGKELSGKVIGVVNNNSYHINE